MLLVFVPRIAHAECKQPSLCEAFDYANKASDVYKDGHFPQKIKCGDKSVDSISDVPGDGFYAEVYRLTKDKDGKDGFVIAFRGTKEGQDWLDDLDQGLNGHNLQFAQAKEYFGKVQDVLKNGDCANVPKTIVGHSLGGALAQYVAREKAGPEYTTVTFNPAGLLPGPIIGPTIPRPPACVFNYANENDPLRQIVNPLLKELGKIDSKKLGEEDSQIAAGYIGTKDIVLQADGQEKMDLKLDSFHNLTSDDIQEWRELLKDEDLRNLVTMWKGSAGETFASPSISVLRLGLEYYSNGKQIPVEIVEVLSRHTKCLTTLVGLFENNKKQWPDVADKYNSLVEGLKAVATAQANLAKWEAEPKNQKKGIEARWNLTESKKRAQTLVNEFLSVAKELDDLGTAHSIGDWIETQPAQYESYAKGADTPAYRLSAPKQVRAAIGHYTPGSMLDLLQGLCDAEKKQLISLPSNEVPPTSRETGVPTVTIPPVRSMKPSGPGGGGNR